jgi:uncharacterized RDD family membrane protein YckC
MEHQPDIDRSEAVLDPSPQEESTTLAPTPEAQHAPPLEETHDRAGFWLRLVAFSIDMTILTVFSLSLLLVGILAANVDYGLSDLLLDSDDSFPLIPLWISGTLTATAAYFTILHSEYGQTIGKSLLRLEVRTSSGALLSYSQALFRWLAYGLSSGFGGLGFLWIAATPGKRGWHDLLAHTIVVTPKH